MKRVLVAPLDWGLGHTARCIPVISELIKAGADIYFAGNKSQIAFVSQHGLKFKTLELFGYNVSYSSIFPQWMKVGFQSLRLKKIIEKENKWLQQIVEEKKIDIVISDNRFGLHNSSARCIFITHQLNIPSPLFAKNVNIINADFINRFHECWIPDNELLLLSGQLSAKATLNIPVKRVGLLSRFDYNRNDPPINFDIALLLSGVEPQRSVLEQKLIDYFRKTSYRVALIRGTTGQLTGVPATITQFGLLNSLELQNIISQSEVVICRSGYSSVMDLVNLQKKMFLVPTPGQPEQEYLAEYFNKKFRVPFIEQNAISKLGIQLSEARTIEIPSVIKSENLLATTISGLLNNN